MSYLQKRQHLSAVALGRRMFAGIPGMTPARFDLLHVLYVNMRTCPLAAASSVHGGDGMMPQGYIAPRLGLSRQTVSKMIRRLIELGWLDQYRCSADARRMLVGLTEDGAVAIEKAYSVAFADRYPTPPQPDDTRPPRWVRRIALEEARDQKWIAGVYEKLARDGRIHRPKPGDGHEPLPKPPKKLGRDVASVFTTLAQERAGVPNRERRLDALHTMLQEAYTLARALGDTSSLIYRVPKPLKPEKKEPVAEWKIPLIEAMRTREPTPEFGPRRLTRKVLPYPGSPA